MPYLILDTSYLVLSGRNFFTSRQILQFSRSLLAGVHGLAAVQELNTCKDLPAVSELKGRNGCSIEEFIHQLFQS